MFQKTFIVLAVLASLCSAKVVNIKNGQAVNLTVDVAGNELTVLAGGFASVDLEAGTTGTISAVPENAEVHGPRTKVEITLEEASDMYAVSLVEGFNMGVKVIPSGSSSCESVVCAANILNMCPLANQVTNSLGSVVACQNSPLIMSKVCSGAIVDEATAVNVQTCADATALLVVFI